MPLALAAVDEAERGSATRAAEGVEWAAGQRENGARRLLTMVAIAE
jgi:hypothetical protein